MIITPLLGTIINAVHMFASQELRGASMPVDGVLYRNVLTLLVFLFFRIPGIWQGENLEKPNVNQQAGRNAAAFSLVAVGLLTLTIQFIMVTTHTISEFNYADVWNVALSILGGALLLSGVLTSIAPSNNSPIAEATTAATIINYPIPIFRPKCYIYIS